MDLPAVGTRISLSGSLGTIKFSGEVENAKGVWLGVEWDDASRGKHSGTKDGKHYFHCRWGKLCRIGINLSDLASR